MTESNVSTPVPSVARRLRAAEDTLTPSDRAIAALVVADPVLLSYLTVEQTAQRAGVSKAAVVRFAARLGYRGFGELRAELRHGIRRQADLGTLSPPAPGLERGADDAAGIRPLLAFRLAQAIASLSRFVEQIDEDELLASVDLLLDPAATVHVVGQRRAHAVALYAYRQICWLRDDTRYFHPEELGLQVALHAIRPGDVVLLIAFRRHARVSQLVLRHASRVGARTILVADPACPFLHLADHALVCPAFDGGYFDSVVPTTFCLEALLALMIERMGQARAVAHVRQIQSYQEAVDLESVDEAPAAGGRGAPRDEDAGQARVGRLSPGMLN